MSKTIFQKIMDGEIPSEPVFEDNQCVVLKDINPQAPTHLLVVPRKLIPRIGEAEPEDENLLGHLLIVAAEAARSQNLGKGYRIVINNGPDGGESVPHLHVHVLGGRPLTWPPG